MAWKNPDFNNAELNVTEDDSVGWQYLPIKDFKTFSRWAMQPEEHTLEEVEWYGKPFWAENLYRVAKWGKTNFFIGLRGGLPALEDMSIEEVKDRKFWELNSEQKNRLKIWACILIDPNNHRNFTKATFFKLSSKLLHNCHLISFISRLETSPCRIIP